MIFKTYPKPMIYFKLPFDERLYSADEKNNKNTIDFYSYDSLNQINFNGNKIEVSSEDFDQISISNGSFPEDNTGFIAETDEEYYQNLQQVIRVIKENDLPKLVYSRRKIFTDFNTIDYKKALPIYVHPTRMHSGTYSTRGKMPGWELFLKYWENSIKQPTNLKPWRWQELFLYQKNGLKRKLKNKSLLAPIFRDFKTVFG